MKALAFMVWDKKIFKNFLLYLYVKSENQQHRTNFEDPWVKHFTTEPRGTQVWDKKVFKNFLFYLYAKSENPQHRTNFYSRTIIWSILVEGH